MRYNRGNSRFQQSFLSIEDQISKGHFIRIIDAICEDFCTSIQVAKGIKDTGRKAYHPADLLKILVYGYFNGISSSRKLERETQRNIELKWLTSNVVPDHKTISDFRKDNPVLVDGLFKYLIIKLKEEGLITGRSIGVDGTKVKAYASKEISIKMISEKLQDLDKQAEKYLTKLDAIDQAEDEVEELERKKAELERQLDVLASKKKEYEKLGAYLKTIEKERESVTDPESSMVRGRTGSYWGYNIQSAVDTTYHFITAIAVSSQTNDLGLLPAMVAASEEVTQKKAEECIADAGYYKINDLETLEQGGTQCYVALHKAPSQIKDELHKISFTYDQKDKVYHCSEGKILVPFTNKKRAHGKVAKAYKGTQCHLCAIREKCTTAEQRTIHRNENQDWIDRYFKKMNGQKGKEKLIQRKSVVEHPFGTMKYAMGQIPLLLRSKKKVRTEINLYAIGYNLKRYFNLRASENGNLKKRTVRLAA